MRVGAVTVLVVDDEPSLRFLCRVNLELEGFSVREAATLAEARRHLGSSPIDVVLLDVHVAGGDGRDLLEELRSQDSPVRVVMFTGSVDTASGRFDAADRVITKPFEPRELIDAVRELSRTAPIDSAT